MFIEQLNENEIIDIAKTLLNIVTNDPELTERRISNSTITHHADAITITFKSYYEDQQIGLSDFDAYITYGSYDTPEKITRTYRKIMFNIFNSQNEDAKKPYNGEQYRKALEEFYKKPIEENYRKQLNQLQEDIDAFTTEI